MSPWYGSGPLHLLTALTGLALAGWGLARALDVLGNPANFLLWLGGAVILHDLVLFPLYSLVELGASAIAGPERSALRLAALNHVPVPAGQRRVERHLPRTLAPAHRDVVRRLCAAAGSALAELHGLA